RNSGENPGVISHEWGHGLDYNDGAPLSRPAEGTADIFGMLAGHTSCIGRGWGLSNCTLVGYACLDCTGPHEQDWDQRANHEPSTPQFVADHCPTSGDGPCGYACEGYIPGETMWDLATRDLPASGLDPETAWQLTDRLWYLSRPGSGGNMYN